MNIQQIFERLKSHSEVSSEITHELINALRVELQSLHKIAESAIAELPDASQEQAQREQQQLTNNQEDSQRAADNNKQMVIRKDLNLIANQLKKNINDLTQKLENLQTKVEPVGRNAITSEFGKANGLLDQVGQQPNSLLFAIDNMQTAFDRMQDALIKGGELLKQTVRTYEGVSDDLANRPNDELTIKGREASQMSLDQDLKQMGEGPIEEEQQPQEAGTIDNNAQQTADANVVTEPDETIAQQSDASTDAEDEQYHPATPYDIKTPTLNKKS